MDDTMCGATRRGPSAPARATWADAIVVVSNASGQDPWSSLAPDLALVEQELESHIATAAPRVGDIAQHLLRAGGKRLRPAAVLASARAIEPAPPSPALLRVCAAIELLHVASLYHDDVLDAASVRRGVPSANALWGNDRAVLAGDVLIALATQLTIDVDPLLTRRLCDTVVDLCAGQIDEAATRYDIGRSVERYLSSIQGKTASLLATACWFGAHVAGAPPAQADRLGGFGHEVGIAFQIVDDLLDLFADEDLIGKASGSDVREGVFTLPVLLAMERDRELADLLRDHATTVPMEAVRDRVRTSGASDAAVQVAVDRLRAGLALLIGSDVDPADATPLVALVARVLRPLSKAGISAASLTDLAPASALAR